MPLESRTRPAVLLVENHRAVRDALAQLIEENGLTVAGQAASREEALGLALTEQPDVALVDISLGDSAGISLVEELNRVGIPVVVCSSHEEPEYVRRALHAGARAYVAKRDVGRALVRTLRDVLNGWVLVSPRAADDLTNAP